MKSKIGNTFILLITAVVWGVAFVFQRMSTGYIGTFSYNGIRFIMGTLALIPVALLFERGKGTSEINRKTVFYGIITGVILFSASNLQQFGIDMTQSAGKSAFITGLYTVLVPIAYLILFRRKTGINAWIGAAFAVVGLYLLCDASGNFGWGDIVLFIGSLFWTAHIMIIDKATDMGVRPIRYSQVQFLTVGILSMICSLIFEEITLQGVKGALIPILYGGFMSTGVAYTCQVIGQKNADPTVATIVLSTESLWAAVSGVIILDETMSPPAALGCALMFSGILISQANIKWEKKI